MRTNFKCRGTLRNAAVAAVLTSALFFAGCAGDSSGIVLSAPASATPLAVTGAGSEGITAAYLGSSVFLSAPASSGCGWSASLAKVVEPERVIVVQMHRENVDPCGANFFIETFEMQTDADLAAEYTVQVRID